MSDLVGNPEDRFSRVVAHMRDCQMSAVISQVFMTFDIDFLGEKKLKHKLLPL